VKLPVLKDGVAGHIPVKDLPLKLAETLSFMIERAVGPSMKKKLEPK
jgi:hypothetical protein